MLDEWRNEAGVQPLEGWTFQVMQSVTDFRTLFSSESHISFSSRRSMLLCLFLVLRSNTTTRDHVYFKSSEMQGALLASRWGPC